MTESIVVTISALLAVSFACQWLAWRLKLPAILFLLVSGILAGPVTGLLEPDRLMGDLFFPFVSLSVAVILFEGSLTLKINDIAGMRRVIRNLVSYGMLTTWVITTVICRMSLDFSWEISFLFGAVTVVTGPTVITPMLRTVRPNIDVANILRWEGILIDPIGATLAVLVYEFILIGAGAGAWWHTAWAFGSILLTGLMLGWAVGYLFGIVLRRHWLPRYLHNLSALFLVTATFTLANLLQEESGLLAVTVMGLWLTNMKDVMVDEILDFKESLSILLISLLFILLAARIDLNDFKLLGGSAILVFLSIQFLSRPLSVMVSAIGSRLSWPERHLLAWIAPRGIIAAAISAVFAIRLETAGFAEAPLLVPLTFMVIVGTVVLQSATAGPLARFLKVAEPDPKGFLIIGANPVARHIASAVERHGFRALLADTSWEHITTSRMEGLSAYWGNPVSEHADRHLDLVGIGRLLALTPHGDQNALAATHYRMEFGPGHIFTISTKGKKEQPKKMEASKKRTGQQLFGEEVTFAKLASRLSQGNDIRSTRLTESFGFEDIQQASNGAFIPLFAVDPRGDIHVFTVEAPPEPTKGWTLISLKASGEGAVAPTAGQKGKNGPLPIP